MKLIKPKIVRITKHHKKINLPSEMSNELAELLGIHFGDGSIYIGEKKDYRVLYCFNILEKDIIQETKETFKKLFGIELKEKPSGSKNAIELCCYSKMLCYFLHTSFGTPFGKKK